MVAKNRYLLALEGLYWLLAQLVLFDLAAKTNNDNVNLAYPDTVDTPV